MLFSDGADRQEIAATSVGEDGVELALLLLDLGVQTVEIGRFGSVGLDTGYVAADFTDSCFQFRLTASGDVDMGAFRHKALGGRQANTARTASDQGDFAFEFLAHDALLCGDARSSGRH